MKKKLNLSRCQRCGRYFIHAYRGDYDAATKTAGGLCDHSMLSEVELDKDLVMEFWQMEKSREKEQS